MTRLSISNTSKVSQYLLALSQSLEFRRLGDSLNEDALLDQLDTLWYSMSEAEIQDVKIQLKNQN
jgi:hypothetical protein